MWSRKYNKCQCCGTIESRHLGRGLCSRCYQRDIESKSIHRKQVRIRGQASLKMTKQFIIEEYLEKKKSLLDIANECGCSRVYVGKKAKEYNISLRSKKEARTIALNDGKLKFEKIDDLGNIKKIILQKINANEAFFSKWTEGMAYVLGVIYTDGYLDPGILVDPKRKTTRKMAFFSISQKEPELLEKVLKLMDCDAKLYYTPKIVYGSTVAGELYRI